MDFNVLDYGAVPGADTLQTGALQKALDACFLAGGGTVVVPAGVYRTGDLRLRSHTTLLLKKDARLLGSRDPMEYFHHREDRIEPLRPEQITDAPYVHLSTIKGETQYEEGKPEYRFKRIPSSRWNNGLIRAIDARDIAIVGEDNSFIDGNDCYDAEGEEHYRGPHAVMFFGCRNIRLTGYSIERSANWAHNLLFCDNVTVDGVRVYKGHDGFDAAVCNNIVIRNSEFYTGDDCIAGFGNTNVLVEDCVLNSACSAFRFGGTNVQIERCRIYGPGKYLFRGRLTPEEKAASAPSATEGGRRNMLSAFTYYADYSVPIPRQPGNIVMKDCTVDNADRLLHYNFSGNETWQRYRPLADLRFENVRANGIKMPLTAYGHKDVPITLSIENCEIILEEENREIDLLRVGNFKEIRLTNLRTNAAGEALVRKWSDGKLILENVRSEAKNRILDASEEFSCKKI